MSDADSAPVSAGADPKEAQGLLRIISGSDAQVDTVYVGGLFLILVFCGLAIFQAVKDPASFSPINFATAGAALLGAISGAKTMRDRLGQQGS